MVYSEDSLVERAGSLNIEPTREQLIATGELDPDELDNLDENELEEDSELEDDGEHKEDEVPTKTAISVVETHEKPSIRKQITARLTEGASREELEAEGYSKRSIQTIASELKIKLNTRKGLGKAITTTSRGLPIFAKGAPPEAIIEAIEVPDVSNGMGYPFEQGIKFGMSLVTLGIRMAQELSGIGVMQAKPLLDMAKSMREGESLAAKNAAGEAAMEAAGMVQQSIMPALANLQSKAGAGEDPVKGMMVRTMEPIMNKIMGGMFSKLGAGNPTLQAPQLTQGNSSQEGIDGWTRRSE